MQVIKHDLRKEDAIMLFQFWIAAAIIMGTVLMGAQVWL